MGGLIFGIFYIDNYVTCEQGKFYSPPALNVNRQKDMTMEVAPLWVRRCPIYYWQEWKMSTHNSRKNEVAGLKWKWHRVVDMSGGEYKV